VEIFGSEGGLKSPLFEEIARMWRFWGCEVLEGEGDVQGHQRVWKFSEFADAFVVFSLNFAFGLCYNTGKVRGISMVTYYFSDPSGAMKQVGHIQRNCWIDMVAPTEAEVKLIAESLKIPTDFITDALDTFERARIEEEEGALLIIVDFPITEGDAFETMPMGIIMVEHQIVTVCLKENPILEPFRKKQVKNFFTYKKSRFALQILQGIAVQYLRDLRLLNRKTEEAERALHESVKNKQLFDMMNIEKSLVYMLTSLKSKRMVLEKIRRQKVLRMYEEDEELLEDVIIETSQALEMAEIHSNVLGGSMDAYASIINNNMNEVMKFLTLVTIVLTVPTLVFSFYGMNVDFPPATWVQTIILSLVLAMASIWILWVRKVL